MNIYHSASSKETELLGEVLAAKVSAKGGSLPAGRRGAPGGKSGKHALVFALHGDLGSGKTTFVKGFFRGLGVKSRVKSPTFVIMRRSEVRGTIFTNVFHIDAYRIRKPEDLLTIDFKTIISNPKNIILIEWPENAKGIIPRNARRIEFRYGKKENERKIILSCHRPRRRTTHASNLYS